MSGRAPEERLLAEGLGQESPEWVVGGAQAPEMSAIGLSGRGPAQMCPCWGLGTFGKAPWKSEQVGRSLQALLHPVWWEQRAGRLMQKVWPAHWVHM